MKLLVTPGMGIGPEVTARALAEVGARASFELLGDGAAIRAALDEHGVSAPIVDLRGREEPAPILAVREAAQRCARGEGDAMVTGPIHKGRLIAQGFNHMGHTDMLGDVFGVDPVMAFAGGTIRVALVTTHIELAAVKESITAHRVRYVVQTSNAALRADLGIAAPRLALCGLNPHAGEGGELGRTELDVLAPVAKQLREEGIDVVGPVSAETAFMDAVKGHHDMVIAMFHDQGLVPLKVLDFGRSVNWTLGLPIIRTSVDHGTADDLVGLNSADHSSMVAAIELAMALAQSRS